MKKAVIISTIIFVCIFCVGAVLYYCNTPTLDGVELDFVINDTLPDGEGKSATVIFLGGQSNASGCSRDDYLKMSVSEEKYAEYEQGYDNVYINYFATGTNISEGFVRCARAQGEAGGYFGPELGMAERLNELYPDESFFIIKYAWGGSNLYEQWRSPSDIGRVGELYRAFTEFAHVSIDYLVSKNYDVKIVGMCWMQGESDSFGPDVANAYGNNLKCLIRDVRKEFSDYAGKDGIAFIDAYISDSPYWTYYSTVNEKKQEVADSSSINFVIDTISHGLTYQNEPLDTPDLAHYDAISQIKLGQLFIDELAKHIKQ